MKSKKDKSIDFLKPKIELFQCPLCNESVMATTSLQCLNKHSFDFSKTGYLNLASQSSDKKYNASFFKERYKIMGEKNMYQPLVDLITDIFPWTPNARVLDGGTGEGSLLASLPQSFKVGVDLAKDGIVLASKHYEEHVWLIADLANLPLQNETMDLVLSILSPANYLEFKRVLKPDGMIIKVIPNQDYFKEIRTLKRHDDFDNRSSANRFKEEVPNWHMKSLYYTIDVDEEDRESLIKMSPIAWDYDVETIERYIKDGANELTIDLSIFYGRRG